MVKAKVKEEVFEIVWDAPSNKMTVNGKPWDWNMVKNGQLLHIVSNGKSYIGEWIDFHPVQQTAEVKINGHHYILSIEQPLDALLKKMGFSSQSEKKVKELKAPMPGMVLKVLVKEGDEISKDQPLLILEAMKMENVIKAVGPAKVGEIKIIEGQAVEKGAILIAFT
jgi:biotin carboxyl carrier protein